MEFVQGAFLLRRSLILPEVNYFPEDTGSITAPLPVLVLCLALQNLKRFLQAPYVSSS